MPNNKKYKYTFYALDVGYVGSTREKINERMRNHRHDCYKSKLQYKYPLYKHIRKHYPGYNFDAVNVVILDVVSGLTEAQARAVEQEYINQLKPELNSDSAKRELSDKEYALTKVPCVLCGAIVTRSGMSLHRKSNKHKNKIKEIEAQLNQYYKTSEDKHHCTLKHNEKFK